MLWRGSLGLLLTCLARRVVCIIFPQSKPCGLRPSGTAFLVSFPDQSAWPGNKGLLGHLDSLTKSVDLWAVSRDFKKTNTHSHH